MIDELAEAPLTGVVEKVLYHTDETGYAVLKVTPKGAKEMVTVVGNLPSINAGEEVTATGAWVDNEAYGRQFKATELKSSPPDSNEGLVKFLGSGLIDGIGPKYAKRVVEKFGSETFEILDTASKRLEEVDGIGAKRRREIKKSWEAQKAMRQIMLFLHGHGISGAKALRIYRTYGDRAESVLREDPYQLVRDVHGFGFKTADAIAKRLGTDDVAPGRRDAALRHVLQTGAQEGHCGLPKAKLIDDAAALLGVAQELIVATLEESLSRADLTSYEDLIYLPYLDSAEYRVAKGLRFLAAQQGSYPSIDSARAIAWCEEKLGASLAEGQKEALEAALQHRLTIITGGPGVGKTTVLRSLLSILTVKKVETVLAAPTGRAAKRMTESSGVEAKTLHRLLEFQADGGFVRRKEHPLKGQAFIVDEASMIDVNLMAALVDALPDNGHLVLIGDIDQLPSVGPGAVLRDVIDSGVGTVIRLTEIFRQAAGSRILTAAHAIHAGHLPPLEMPPAGQSTDFYWFEREDAEASLTMLKKLVVRHIPDKFGFELGKDLQVLTPMNKGILGTANLNRQLQAVMNGPNEYRYEVERFGAVFRVGDRVIQLRNNYEKEVFNGDLGSVVEITTDPVRITVRFESGELVEYEPGELDELRLAYAITIHKSQGSEFPAIVIPVTNQHYHLLQRSLIYTAVTRGKQLVVLIGETKALELAVMKTQSGRRYSGLGRRMTS